MISEYQKSERCKERRKQTRCYRSFLFLSWSKTRDMDIWNDTCLCARRTPSRRTTSTLKAACPSLRSGCRTTSRWWRGSSSALRCYRSVPRTFGCRANASCSQVLRVSNSSCVSSTDLWNLFGSKLSERHRGRAGELVRKRCTHVSLIGSSSHTDTGLLLTDSSTWCENRQLCSQQLVLTAVRAPSAGSTVQHLYQ